MTTGRDSLTGELPGWILTKAFPQLFNYNVAIPPGSAGWTGEPGTSQSVTPARADINTPHREVGTDPSRARAAMAPPWTHGQGRFSSELGLRRRCLKYHRAACGCHRLWGLPHFLLRRAQAPSKALSQGQCYSWQGLHPHVQCTFLVTSRLCCCTEVPGPARPLPAA